VEGYRIYRFEFQASTPEAQRFPVTIRLRVSETLLTMRRWAKLGEAQRRMCFFQFVRDRLDHGLPDTPELELNNRVPQAEYLPELCDPSAIRMMDGFYIYPGPTPIG
jgi:hypothetical protein